VGGMICPFVQNSLYVPNSLTPIGFKANGKKFNPEFGNGSAWNYEFFLLILFVFFRVVSWFGLEI